MATDAFGRLRVSQPITTFDYNPSLLTGTSSLNRDVWVSTTTGTAAATYNANTYIELSCSAANDKVTRTTKTPMVYQPGKSRLIYMTGVPLITSSTGTITSRIGLIDINDSQATVEGVWFETNGVVLTWVEQTQHDTISITQSSWNIDPFDGTGPSGLTLSIGNVAKTMLLVIDQEWLGVGRVRVGFILDGIIYYAHQFTHAGYTTTYTSSPMITLCYQLVAGADFSGSAELRQICSTSISEGGYIPLGKRNSISTTMSGVNMSSNSAKFIIMALRIKSGFPKGILKPLKINILFPSATGTQYGKYELQVHSTNGPVGTIGGTALSYTSLTDSIAEYAIGNGSNQVISSDGYIINSGFLAELATADYTNSEFETLLVRTILSKYDTLYLVGQTTQAGGSLIYGSLDFVESI